MNKLSLGTVQFGMEYGITNSSGKISELEVKKILNLARKKNINFLDTAFVYGDSEDVLGRSGVKEFKIVSKLPKIPEEISDINQWVEHKVSQSLIRLDINKIYACLLHDYQDNSVINFDKIIKALKNVQSKGLVNKIGISIYSPRELEKIKNIDSIDIVQAPMNIFDRRLELSGWLSYLYQNGIEIHIRSVFLQGLLLLSRDKIPKKFEKWSEIWNYWDSINHNKKENKIANSLNYINSFKEISKILVGIENLEQLNEILNIFENINSKLIDLDKISNIDEMLIDPRKWKNL